MAVDRPLIEPPAGSGGTSGCGAGGQLVAGAVIGGLAGFIFAIATGRSEAACSAAGAVAGAVLLLAFGC